MKKILIWMIHFYQKNISARRPACCRYSPTCSAYMIQAIEYHGIIKGLCLGIWRILRCNPWGGKGDDPVPLKSIKGENII